MAFKIVALLILTILTAILGFYGYLSWNIIIGFFILYIFSIGLMIEIEEIETKESLKEFLSGKIGIIENLINNSTQKIDSDFRIKERLNKRKKEIIEWLNKL